jgi:hypothetical protein
MEIVGNCGKVWRTKCGRYVNLWRYDMYGDMKTYGDM